MVLVGSVIFTFVFNYVYTAIDSRQKFMDTYWVLYFASTRAYFWFLILLAPVICLFPRWVGVYMYVHVHVSCLYYVKWIKAGTYVGRDSFFIVEG